MYLPWLQFWLSIFGFFGNVAVTCYWTLTTVRPLDEGRNWYETEDL